MQYRVYDRQTLSFKDGGYVQSFTIDDDYIVNNSSTIYIVKTRRNAVTVQVTINASGTYSVYEEYRIIGVALLSGDAKCLYYTGNTYQIEVFFAPAVFSVTYVTPDSINDIATGDIVALIKDSGAFHKGVVTSVDVAQYSISYKSDKELFNDTALNIMRSEEGKFSFGIDEVVSILENLYVKTTDRMKRLPISFVTEGDVVDESGNGKMLWNWSTDSFNLVDWLTELFEKYYLSLSWTIDFNTSVQQVKKRNPRYVCTISAITNDGGMIKDNVFMQKIKYKESEIPDATVCIIIDSSDKQVRYISNGINLLDPKAVKENTIIAYEPKDKTWVDEVKSGDTNLSSYIGFDYKSYYTFSVDNTDGAPRYIIAYNKQRQKLGYWAYSGDVFTFSANGKTFVPSDEVDNNLTDAQIAESIKFIRVNFYNKAKEVQLEKGTSKTAYDPFEIPAVFYLYEKNGEYSISTDSDLKDKKRVLPVKTVVASFNSGDSSSEIVTERSVATEKLIPTKFNQSIEIDINEDSNMFNFADAKFGDRYKIINAQGAVDSIYTGKKYSSKSKIVTLYFGLGRQNYTDIMQIRLRKNKYKEVYNE